ncbi:MAG: 4-amino-4-deoxy-L-arabinose transferase-like glycosyltransferase [Methylophilaceae bacterium]|jgi:4-amino-4-deoxy-L-arabinose transferase-like glycosyltransferase
MRFNLEHDWQGNMSTPRARVGDRAKVRLLILLCAAWLLMGLIGHEPWKPFESDAISTIKNVFDNGHYLAPTSASSNQASNPPLYYLSAALAAKVFNGILPMHDGARIATGFWMLITLLMIGMTGREFWGRGVGRQTSFIFISAIGLIISAHLISPAISALAGTATCFYAFALAKRRPYRASGLLGLGMGVSFLSTGLLPLSIILLTGIALPSFFKRWRTLRLAKVAAMATLIASPMILGWSLLYLSLEPLLFYGWLEKSMEGITNPGHFYFLSLLLWYAWPSLPLAIWGLWRYRAYLFNQPRFQLCITFFIAAFISIGFLGEHKDIYALPLLIPLTALAGGSIETLKRGAASALNWFGLILFGLIGTLIWLGWGAMMSGSPEKLKERLIFLSGLTKLDFSVLALVLASAITLIWLFSTFRSKHSNRAVATNWAIGMTFIWTLLMTLWLPIIDSARSYHDVFTGFKNVLPKGYSCITSKDLGDAQRDLLHYYANVKTQPSESGEESSCDLFLIQDKRDPTEVMLDESWDYIWGGKRISERKESFRLFQQTP